MGYLETAAFLIRLNIQVFEKNTITPKNESVGKRSSILYYLIDMVMSNRSSKTIANSIQTSLVVPKLQPAF